MARKLFFYVSIFPDFILKNGQDRIFEAKSVANFHAIRCVRQ